MYTVMAKRVRDWLEKGRPIARTVSGRPSLLESPTFKRHLALVPITTPVLFAQLEFILDRRQRVQPWLIEYE
jgi:hypothetical protein